MMLAYCSYCVYNLFTRAGNRGRWPASVKLVTLPYLTLPYLTLPYLTLPYLGIKALAHVTAQPLTF